MKFNFKIGDTVLENKTGVYGFKKAGKIIEIGRTYIGVKFSDSDTTWLYNENEIYKCVNCPEYFKEK